VRKGWQELFPRKPSSYTPLPQGRPGRGRRRAVHSPLPSTELPRRLKRHRGAVSLRQLPQARLALGRDEEFLPVPGSDRWKHRYIHRREPTPPPWSPRAPGEAATTAQQRRCPACAPASLDHLSEMLRGSSLGKARANGVARVLSPAARKHSSSTRW
jgi:hypothetical protein